MLILIVVTKLTLQFLFLNPAYELHRDEFLHLDQAFHPAWGYISVPPLTSWISHLIYLLGGGLFWIRLFPALFGAATIILVWKLTEEMGGQKWACAMATTYLAFSVLLRINLLFQPNSFDILAFTAIFWLAVRYINSSGTRWLYALAVAIALGFYNKYNIVFPVFSLLAAIALTEYRRIFQTKALWQAFALCLILILPNLIWQYQNDFPVIQHMNALNQSQLVHVSRIGFIADQLMYGLLGVITIPAIGALFFYKPFKKYRFIGIVFVLTIAIYIATRAKSYYAIGLYPVLFAVGSLFIEKILKRWKAPVMGLMMVTNMVVFAGIAKLLMPVQSPAQIVANRGSYEKMGLLRWEDGKNHQLPQDFADMVGWREMAEKTLIAYRSIPEEELAETIVFCDNYGQTGAVNYYNRGKMAEAYSFNTDYINWLPRKEKITNILLIGEEPGIEIINLFKACKAIGEVTNPYAREKGTKIILLTGAKPEFTGLFYQMAEKRKKTFDIF